ncbi:MAG: T9SS type A sorting domain-containing protein [Ignavibacteriaceae bacterium]|nr:T9SS type A sorting domain-containing protein [Ignavibacteriaceae bacterium]
MIDQNVGVTIGWNNEGGEWMKGILDDIRIYNRALSDQEVSSLYELEKPYTVQNENWTLFYPSPSKGIFADNNGNRFLVKYIGVSKSTDGGSNWVETSYNPPPRSGHNTGGGYAVYGNNIFVGSLDEGVYRSTDAGLTWNNTFGTGFGTASSIMITTPNSVIMNYGGSMRGLYKFSFATNQWNQKISSSVDFWSLCKDNLGNIYAALTAGGDWNGGVYKSTDEGETWVKIHATSGDDNPAHIVYSGNSLVYFTYNSGKVVRSTDNGSTWNQIATIPTGGGHGMIATTNNLIFAALSAGVYYSSDKGLTWLQKNDGINGMARSFSQLDNYLYVGSDSGTYRLKLFDNNPVTGDTTTIWKMAIKPTIAGVADLENFAGVAEAATDGFDAVYDTPEPPFAPGNYVSAYFYHPDWNPIVGSKFAKDIKSDADLADAVHRWYFSVETNVTNDTVTINFEQDRIPVGYGKYLTDMLTGERVNLKHRTNYKYYNTGTTARNFMLIIGDSTSPALSDLYPDGNEIFRSNSDKTISWLHADGTGVDSVYIYTSDNSGSNFAILRQIGDNQNTLWNVPAEYLNHNYLVKIITRDSLGNASEIISNSNFTVVGDSLATPAPAGWSLISTPLNAGEITPNALLADDFGANPFYMWEFRQNEGYRTPELISFGKGYWLGVLSGGNWDVTGEAVEADSTVQTLQPGFNLIGNKYVRDISKTTLSFVKNGFQYTFDEAVSNNLISNTLYGYDGSGYASANILNLFKGYWIGVLTDGVSLIQKPLPAQIPVSTPIAVTENNWEMALELTSGLLSDKTAVIGAKENATVGFDAEFDAPRPPRNPGSNFLELYFENSGSTYPQMLGSRYARDFRSVGEASWVFKVESSENAETRLSWDRSQIQQLPDSIRITLKDMSNNTEVDMKTDSVYNFVYNGVRSFAVNSTVTGIMDNSTIPNDYSLKQNYPNPFNPSTMIQFQLPKSGHTELKVYDLVGREVATLINGTREAGYHQVSFDASGLSSGMYIYRLRSGDFSKTMKMSLVK